MSTATTATTTTTKRIPTPEWKTVYNRSRKAGGDIADLASRTREHIFFEARPCGGTAAWSWDAKHKRHNMVLDRDYVSTIDVYHRVSRTSRVDYGMALLRHEKWHGLRTNRDLPALAAECDKLGIAFDLLNIAEDLRIEHLARLDESTYFSWGRWNRSPVPASTNEPLAWLALYIHHEVSIPHNASKNAPLRGSWAGEPETARVRGGVAGPSADTVDVLGQFALEMANAKSTWDVLAIVKDWVDTFPTAKQKPVDIPGMPSRMGGTGYSSSSSGKWTAMETDYSGPTAKRDPSTLPPAQRRAIEYFLDGTVALLGCSDDDYHRHTGIPVADTSRAPHIANRLASLLGSVSPMRVRTSTSGSRLHVRGVMTNDPASFRTMAQKTGKRRVVAVFDQSGSMHGDWHRHGAAFASALLMLHRRGILDVTVILTGGRSHATLPEWFEPAHVGRFRCNMGCESVDATLAAHKHTLQAADTVLIYTDGHLTDGDVDAGRWRSLGVDLVGCAVTSRGGLHDALCQHFARGITAPTGEQLATRIVQYISTRM